MEISKEYTILKILEVKFPSLKVEQTLNGDPLEISINCPYCGDKKNNLWISLAPKKLGLFHCWVCKTKGHLTKLAPGVDLSKHRNYSITDQDIEQLIQGKQEKAIYMPMEALPKIAKKYLLSRKLPIDRFYWSSKGRYKFRVILPIINYGRLVSFAARTIIGARPKYLYPKGHKPYYMYGLDYINKSKPIYLVEGPFDAVKHNNTLCLNGKNLTIKHCEALKNKGVNKVVLALDPDVEEKALLQAVNIAIKQGFDISIAKLPGCDPGDLEPNKLHDCPIISVDDYIYERII